MESFGLGNITEPTVPSTRPQASHPPFLAGKPKSGRKYLSLHSVLPRAQHGALRARRLLATAASRQSSVSCCKGSRGRTDGADKRPLVPSTGPRPSLADTTRAPHRSVWGVSPCLPTSPRSPPDKQLTHYKILMNKKFEGCRKEQTPVPQGRGGSCDQSTPLPPCASVSPPVEGTTPCPFFAKA